MARHVAPHVLADLEAGRLDDDARAVANAHVDVCDRCRDARERVRAAREAMADIRTDEPDGLRWDHIGARVYWVTSSEQRARARQHGRTRWLVAGAAAAAAVAITGSWWALRDYRSNQAARTAETVPAPAPEPAPSPTVPAPAALHGVVTVVQGDVNVDFDDVVEVGRTIRTGAGRVVVQFGADSAFAVGPDSTLAVRAFDDRDVALVVDGRVDVTLSRRAPDQRFAIVAGNREFAVRGTVFRVEYRDDRLDVACTRGQVVVVDGDREVAVSAGEHLRILDAWVERAAPLPSERLAALEDGLRLPVLPVWTDADAARAASARLDVSAEPAQAVEVDGVEVGAGSLSLRVPPGRHHVESQGKRGEWIELGAGDKRGAVVARAEPEPSRARRSVRSHQLDAALGKSTVRLFNCTRRLREQGTGWYVKLEVGIDRDGTQSYLNILDHNVTPTIARCVRDVVDSIEFPRGPKERVVKKIVP